MTARKDQQDCCVVTIGYTNLLLPAADGLKVLALLRKAVEVKTDYSRPLELNFITGERPRCELAMVSAKQVRPKLEIETPAPRPRKPLLPGQD